MKSIYTFLIATALFISGAFATVFPFPGITFTIQSEDTGRFLSSESGLVRMTANREVATEAEYFVTEFAAAGTFYIKSVSTGKYVRQNGGKKLKCDATLSNATQWKFNTVSKNNGTWATFEGLTIANASTNKNLKEVGTGAADYVKVTGTKTSRSFRWIFAAQ